MANCTTDNKSNPGRINDFARGASLALCCAIPLAFAFGQQIASVLPRIKPIETAVIWPIRYQFYSIKAAQDLTNLHVSDFLIADAFVILSAICGIILIVSAIMKVDERDVYAQRLILRNESPVKIMLLAALFIPTIMYVSLSQDSYIIFKDILAPKLFSPRAYIAIATFLFVTSIWLSAEYAVFIYWFIVRGRFLDSVHKLV